MKVAFDLLRLANERFPIPESSRCKHSLTLEKCEATGETELTLTIHRNEMWQPFYLSDGDLEMSPEDIIDEIADLIKEYDAA